MTRVTNGAKLRPALPTRETVNAALREVADLEPAIAAIYLFGSLGRGTAGPLSDVDVGLLIRDRRQDPAVSERTTDALCRRLRTSRVDVVSLEHSPMPLRYRIVRDGALVVCRDAALLERFIASTVRQYLDFKPLRDQAFRIMRAAILETR